MNEGESHLETAVRIDAPDELSAFLLTLWIPGMGAQAEVVPLDDSGFEVHVRLDGELTPELEERLETAVEKWLADCELDGTTVHRADGDIVVRRRPRVASPSLRLSAG